MDNQLLYHMMQAAYAQSTLSPDPSTQVGAILIPDRPCFEGQVATGHNRLVRDPASRFTESQIWNNREEKYKRVVHAEVAAILDAASLGVRTKGAILVATWACCIDCAKAIVEAGIAAVIVDDLAMQATPERWMKSINEGHQLLKSNGIYVGFLNYRESRPNWFNGKIFSASTGGWTGGPESSNRSRPGSALDLPCGCGCAQPEATGCEVRQDGERQEG